MNSIYEARTVHHQICWSVSTGAAVEQVAISLPSQAKPFPQYDGYRQPTEYKAHKSPQLDKAMSFTWKMWNHLIELLPVKCRDVVRCRPYHLPREFSVYIIAVHICSDAFQIKAASSDERALAGCACWAVVPSGGTLTCYLHVSYVVEKASCNLNWNWMIFLWLPVSSGWYYG